VEIGRGLSVAGETLRVGDLVREGGPILAGDSSGSEGQVEKGLEESVGILFSRESILSNNPTCFQMSSSAGGIRLVDRGSILKSWGTTPGPLTRSEQNEKEKVGE
jgi:hypothetical protein